MSAAHRQIGIVGYGFIGRSLHEALTGSGVEVALVHDHRAENLAAVPHAMAVTDPDAFVDRLADLDLVVEAAHPDVSVRMGARILSKTDYMPCSAAALADDDLREALLAVARSAGTNLYIPHGAIVGIDNLIEARANWQSATITFRKPPASIDAAGQVSEDEVLLFAGSAREIARKFPRSVNAMVACALATVGLDATNTRMIADRRLGEMLRGEFELVGKDGSRLMIIKEEPAKGVSSTGMIVSIKGSVLRALRITTDNPVFV
jgi:aspartate dehydrogenase